MIDSSDEMPFYCESLAGDLLYRGRVKAAYIDADTQKPIRVPAAIFEEGR